MKQIGLVAIGADAVVSKDVADRALLAASPPRLTPGYSTRVKKLPAQTQSLPGAYLINSRDRSFDPEMEPQLVGCECSISTATHQLQLRRDRLLPNKILTNRARILH